FATAIRCYLGDHSPGSLRFKIEFDCNADYFSSEYCLTEINSDKSKWLSCAGKGECDESKLICARDIDLDGGSQICCCKGDLCNDDPDVHFQKTALPPLPQQPRAQSRNADD
ncbi:hypothetical protein PMAYCL1PPCAC_09019, partial [Pristionchus mayeri]